MTRGDQRDRDREKNLKKQQAKAKAQPKVGGSSSLLWVCQRSRQSFQQEHIAIHLSSLTRHSACPISHILIYETAR
jgi:hypothetical protein